MNSQDRLRKIDARYIDRYREPDVDAIPDITEEFEDAISEIAKGEEPKTVTHLLLLERDKGLTKTAIAARIGKTTFQIEGTLAVLESKGWLIRYTENSREKFIIRGILRHQD